MSDEENNSAKSAQGKLWARTDEWMPIFLKALSYHGVVTKAATKAGIDRETVRSRRKTDKDFARAFKEAVRASADVLEREAFRRAKQGTLKPVFFNGSKCGEIREFSDSLMTLLLKARKPKKFRERTENINKQELTFSTATEEGRKALRRTLKKTPDAPATTATGTTGDPTAESPAAG